MLRVTLIHWNPKEGEARAEQLRKAGYEAISLSPQGGNLSFVRQNPPDILVIDLTRMPSNGRAVGGRLRQSPKLRYVPLVFAGGEASKVEKTREVLPDALYASWDDIAATLGHAPRSVPDKPVAPGSMAGYSGTPVAKKLGIRTGSTVTVIGAPDEYPECLDLPDGVVVFRRPGHVCDRVLLFVDRSSFLELRFSAAETAVAPGGGLWIIWPKMKSKQASDVSAPLVRQYALERGWVDYKVCAVDATWSGLLFARKKTN